MSADIAALPKSDLVARLRRASSTIKSVREKAAEGSERAMGVAMGLAGGATCGVLRGWDDEPLVIPGTEIPADVGVAALSIVMGVTGMAGPKASDAITMYGTGVGAGALAFHVRDAVRKERA